MTVIMMKTLWDLWLIEGIYVVFYFFYYRRWLFNLITAWIALWLARELFKGRWSEDGKMCLQKMSKRKATILGRR